MCVLFCILGRTGGRMTQESLAQISDTDVGECPKQPVALSTRNPSLSRRLHATLRHGDEARSRNPLAANRTLRLCQGALRLAEGGERIGLEPLSLT